MGGSLSVHNWQQILEIFIPGVRELPIVSKVLAWNTANQGLNPCTLYGPLIPEVIPDACLGATFGHCWV